jgi:hypothetical protein
MILSSNAAIVGKNYWKSDELLNVFSPDPNCELLT